MRGSPMKCFWGPLHTWDTPQYLCGHWEPPLKPLWGSHSANPPSVGHPKVIWTSHRDPIGPFRSLKVPQSPYRALQVIEGPTEPL